MRIAGKKTDDEWNAFKEKLVIGGTEDLWQTAYNDYFYERLKTRYLNPIKAIEGLSDLDNKEERKKDGSDSDIEGLGEGFSIMAILCTLIEFLEAARQGKRYRYLDFNDRRKVRDGEAIDPPLDNENEYYDGKVYFINFLRYQKPFDAFFTGYNLTAKFYKTIRCGLLHEAQTKEGWLIKIVSEEENYKLIDADDRIVYRDNFKKAFDEYLKSYKKDLRSDQNLQKAFIKTFDNLCIK